MSQLDTIIRILTFITVAVEAEMPIFWLSVAFAAAFSSYFSLSQQWVAVAAVVVTTVITILVTTAVPLKWSKKRLRLLKKSLRIERGN